MKLSESPDKQEATGDGMEIRLRESVIPEATYLGMLMSTTQVANKLGITPKKVRRFIDAGKMTIVRVAGRPYIRRADFEDFARRQGIRL
jgi:excisionase family DNA binding protein